MNAKQRRRFKRITPEMMKFLESVPHFHVKNPTKAQERESMAFFESSKEAAKMLKHLPELKRRLYRGLRQALNA